MLATVHCPPLNTPLLPLVPLPFSSPLLFPPLSRHCLFCSCLCAASSKNVSVVDLSLVQDVSLVSWNVSAAKWLELAANYFKQRSCLFHLFET